ncbi:arrestin domain-containing protein 3-like isoform X1 [Ostrea edulis]|uniref:arrestin domain-containing protein 3-like isoform X1 n=1 Tax=Ostrea edulis TaxID=37623 RepID=UPI002094177C|nr:arrestin domain-containing protein 3-like isoform X1 [Ostrea edulis]
MGKIQNFIIELENQQGVYYPGQVVRGEIVLELSEALKIREIRITFRGEAYVDWPGSSSPYDETSGPKKGGFRLPSDDNYSASEEYFNRTIPLFGNGRGEGDNNILPLGRHTFPFDFGLPDVLPSSFEGPWGYIRYVINATLDRPWSFNTNYKRAFTLISPLDLNTQRNAMHSTSNRRAKRMCCLCCKSGPVSGTIYLDKIGFVPGEMININAEIQNLSSFECDVWAILEMKTIYFSTAQKTRSLPKRVKNPLKRTATENKISEVLVFPPKNPSRMETLKTRKLEKEVTRISHPGVQGGESVVWKGMGLVIPPVPPSFLERCNIIDIRYFLKLVIGTLGSLSNLEIPIEVIIGTVPLRPQLVHQNAHAVVPSAPPMPVPSFASDDQPPSYSECVFGQNDITDEEDNEHTQGLLKFAPVCIFYSNNQPHTNMVETPEAKVPI